MSDTAEHDLREQGARLRQLQVDATRKVFDTIKRAQDIRYAPLTLVATSVGAAAALFGAAVALLKWLGRWARGGPVMPWLRCGRDRRWPAFAAGAGLR